MSHQYNTRHNRRGRHTENPGSGHTPRRDSTTRQHTSEVTENQPLDDGPTLGVTTFMRNLEAIRLDDILQTSAGATGTVNSSEGTANRTPGSKVPPIIPEIPLTNMDRLLMSMEQMMLQNQQMISKWTSMSSQPIYVSDKWTKEPPLFDGNQVAEWLTAFDSSAGINGWTGHRKVAQAGRYMHGPAKIWYDHDISPQDDWESFTIKMYENFPDEGAVNFTKEFYLRTQQEGEDFASFVHEKVRLFKKLDIPFMMGSFLEEILSGSRDAGLKNFIRACKPPSVHELLLLAKRYCPIQPGEGSNVHRNSYTNKTLQQSTSFIRPPNQNSWPRRQESQGPRPKIPSSVVCYNCHEKGHVMSQCPHPRQSSVKLIDLNICNSNTVPQNTIPVLLNENRAEALVDTGAAVNVISADLAQQTQAVLQPVSNVILRDAQGHHMDLVGSVELPIYYPAYNLSSNEVFYVVNHLTKDLLLGKPWCHKHNIAIRFPSNGDPIITFNSDHINDTANKSANTCYPRVLSCKVASETQLAPLTGQFVLATVEIPSATICISQVRCSHPRRSYISPHSLATVTNGETHIFIVNMGVTPLRLLKGTCIGTASIVHDLRVVTQVTDMPSPTPGEHHKPPPSFQTNPLLTADENDELKNLLGKYNDLFRESNTNLSSTTEVRHKINTANHSPVHAHPHRVSPAQRAQIKEQVEELSRQGVIEPSSSPWSSPVVIIKKKDGSPRFCVDYRMLNARTVKDVYPLPRIDDAVDRLAGARYFSTLDLISGYWQIEMDPQDAEKTAFTSPAGLFQFKRMPFGLCNAPATFQRLMDQVLGNLRYDMAMVYLDDVIIFSTTFQEHLIHIDQVLAALDRAGLKLNLRKCHFAEESITYLGHVISNKGVQPDPEKVAQVRKCPVPTSVKQLRSVLGLFSYYRRFIKDFATIAYPLYQALTDWEWTERQQQAFDNIISIITSSPLLAHFRDDCPVIVYTDASGVGLGVVLSQLDKDGVERVVAYGSRKLSTDEQKCHSSETECLAVVWATEKFYPYLHGRSFIIFTDNIALKVLQSKTNLSPKLTRWALKLQEFDFIIRHRPGKANANADFLSRLPSIGLNAITVLQWEHAQAECPHIQDLRNRILNNELKHGERYFIHNNLVYRTGDRGEHHKLVVPASLISEIIGFCHSSGATGHPGVYKTFKRIQERYHIKGLMPKVKTFIQKCSNCQKRRSISRKEGFMHEVPLPQRPFEKIGMDLAGPFSIPGHPGYSVVCAVDYFSKYVKFWAFRKVRSIDIQRVVEDILFEHGAIDELVTDNATIFRSRALRTFLEEHHIRHLFTAVGHPQTNGLAERTIRSLNDKLCAIIEDGERRWKSKLPALSFALNTSVQSSTMKTPFEIVYGRQAILPGETCSLPQPKDPVQIRVQAAAHNKKAQGKQKIYFDRNRTPSAVFVVGQRVLVLNKRMKPGYSAKLIPTFMGPCVIERQLGDSTYRVYNPETGHRFTSNVASLKQFHSYEDAAIVERGRVVGHQAERMLKREDTTTLLESI
jgi:hypothetical protein